MNVLKWLFKIRVKSILKKWGFVYAPIHNIQQPTPVENILAFYNTAQEYNSKM